jgi:hypothetical protein
VTGALVAFMLFGWTIRRSRDGDRAYDKQQQDPVLISLIPGADSDAVTGLHPLTQSPNLRRLQNTDLEDDQNKPYDIHTDLWFSKMLQERYMHTNTSSSDIWSLTTRE